MRHLAPGDRVRILQRIRRRDGEWTAAVTGVVEQVLDAPTGSWYAHGKNDKYWLRRVRLRKDNGEVSVVALDGDSEVVLLGDEETGERKQSVP